MSSRKVASLYCFLKLLKDFLRNAKPKMFLDGASYWYHFYKPPDLSLFKGVRGMWKYVIIPHTPTYTLTLEFS